VDNRKGGEGDFPARLWTVILSVVEVILEDTRRELHGNGPVVLEALRQHWVVYLSRSELNFRERWSFNGG
jgi:hypothetical protein